MGLRWGMSPLKIHWRSALGVVPPLPAPSGFKPLKINHSRLQCQNWNCLVEQAGRIRNQSVPRSVLCRCPSSGRGSDIAACWFHNNSLAALLSPLSTLSQWVQLTSLQITGICGKELPASLQAVEMSNLLVFSNLLVWLHGGESGQRSFQFLVYSYSLFLVSGTVLEPALYTE